MARARSIKPGFFRNEKLAELGSHAMLLFAGLWTIADRAGRLEDRPKRIKADVFPYFKQDIEKLLTALDRAGFIKRYMAGGVPYISIPTWNKHQNPHKNEAPTAIPEPEEYASSTRTAPEDSSSNRADSLFSDSCNLTPDSLNLEPDSGNPEPGTSGLLVLSESEGLLRGLQRIYAEGGRPWNHRDEINGAQLFLSKSLQVQTKICEYVTWAFTEGFWRNPAKTKGFANLLEDGDGEHGAPNRTLPRMEPKQRSKRDEAQDRAAQAFIGGTA